MDSVLLLILFAGAALRFWGISCGLPHTAFKPDEQLVVQLAARFGSGDLNPHFFVYPSLFLYTLYFCFLIASAFSAFFGAFVAPKDFLAHSYLNPWPYFLAARCLSAVLGTATIAMLYKAAQRLFDKDVARISALFLAFAYLHARSSHFGVTDAPMTFMLMAAFMAILNARIEKPCELAQHDRQKSEILTYLLTGAISGLAVSVKYPAVFIAVPMYVVHVQNTLNKNNRKLADFFLTKPLAAYAVAAVAATLLASPYIVLDFKGFTEEFRTVTYHLKYGFGLRLGRGWIYHVRESLFHGLGLVQLCFSLLGAFILLKSDFKKALIVLAFPAAFYVITGRSYLALPRYAVPLTPFICLSAAVLVVFAVRRIRESYGQFNARVGLTVLAVLVIAQPCYNLLRFDALLSTEDNRLRTVRLMKDSIPQGSSVYQPGFSNMWGALQFTPCEQSLKKFLGVEELPEFSKKVSERIEDLEACHVEEWDYHFESGRFSYQAALKDTTPDYIVVHESPLINYSKGIPELAELIDDQYVLEFSTEAMDINAADKNVYVQNDAFYVPFAGFKGLERPGPNFFIYKRKN